MANEINENGISIQTFPEIKEQLIEGYKGVYGQDISIDDSSPDGSKINIEAMAKADILNYSVMLYNFMNVDTTTGTPQDILYKINGVYRKASAFTFVDINVTVTKGLNLQGLDDDISNPDGAGYTVADSNGNEFILTNSTSLTVAGTYTLEFRAKNIGAVEVLPNTIINPVTVIAGVSGVTNPSVEYIVGASGESDSEFRIRRNRSTAISSKGFMFSLENQLDALDFVSFSKVWENKTAVTDADNIPPHSIWTIVQGGADSEVAQTIYANLGMGVNMKGSTVYTVIKENGETQDILFDRPVSQDLYIQMTVKSNDNIQPDTDFIKRELVNNVIYNVYDPAYTTGIICATAHIDDKVNVLECKISSDNMTWVDFILPDTKLNFWALDIDRIDITLQV